MARLVLLGGPPGVGKTTQLAALTRRLKRAGVLDADDICRFSTDVAEVDDRALAHDTVTHVLRNYLAAGCETVVLGWVFARSALYQPVIDQLADVTDDVRQLYLVASRDQLTVRFLDRHAARADTSDPADPLAYALGRLDLIEALPFPRIDTSALTPDEVTDRLVTLIEA